MAIAVVTQDYLADAERWMKLLDVTWEDIRTDPMALRYYGFQLLRNDSVGLAEFNHITGRVKIKTWPVVSEDPYFTCMHELGHVYHQHYLALGAYPWMRPRLLLRAEAEAWDWAYRNALSEPSPETLRSTQEAFGTYIRDFGRHYVPPVSELHPYLREV